jgi:hypothetical protein
VLLEREPDPDFFPPRLEAPGEFAMRAARLLDMPFFFNLSYCFSFFTLGLLFGISDPPLVPVASSVYPRARFSMLGDTQAAGGPVPSTLAPGLGSR